MSCVRSFRIIIATILNERNVNVVVDLSMWQYLVTIGDWIPCDGDFVLLWVLFSSSSIQSTSAC